jgi:hypothetical protein
MLLQSCNSICWRSPGGREDVEAGSEKMLFEQLPPLATDVARVDMVRDYAGEYLSMSYLVSCTVPWLNFLTMSTILTISMLPIFLLCYVCLGKMCYYLAEIRS